MKRIIIDTDLALGEFLKDVDDGLAITMALNSPELDVVAISGVYGNTSLKNVSKNVPELLSRFPEKQNLPEYIEGASSYIDWRNKVKLPGISRMREVIEKNAPITLAPIGPLTNIALLFYHFPEILENKWVEELVIMGGALDSWEFNFANDPAATQFVLDLSIPTVVCGYETCMAQKFTREHYEILKKKDTLRTRLMVKEIKGWLKMNELIFRSKPKGFYPFDTIAITYLLNPDLFKSDKISVYSTNVDKKRYKKFDFSTKTHQRDNSTDDTGSSVFWTKKINSEAFLRLLIDRLY